MHRKNQGCVMNKYWLLAPAPLLAVILAGCATSPGSPGSGFTTPELAGTRWVVTSIDGSAPAGPALTADFGNDGRVSGDAGCNSYSGPFIQDGRNVQFGELLSTRRACVDDGRQRQETRVLNILQGPTTLQLNRNRLTVRGRQGYVVLTLSEPQVLSYQR
jgi:heat shock protein HslJ